MIKEVYRQRMLEKNISVKNADDLVKLLKNDEKSFYFFLMHAYLEDLDLTGIADNDYAELRIALSLFCDVADKTLKESSIRQYFDKYMYTKESSEQIDKVVHELLREKAIREIGES